MVVFTFSAQIAYIPRLPPNQLHKSTASYTTVAPIVGNKVPAGHAATIANIRLDFAHGIAPQPTKIYAAFLPLSQSIIMP